jgi:hypothetical protein
MQDGVSTHGIASCRPLDGTVLCRLSFRKVRVMVRSSVAEYVEIDRPVLRTLPDISGVIASLIERKR